MVNHVFLPIPAALHMTNANKIAVQTTTLSEEFLIIQRLNSIASRNFPVDHQIAFNKSIFNIYKTQPQVIFIHLNKGEGGSSITFLESLMFAVHLNWLFLNKNILFVLYLSRC